MTKKRITDTFGAAADELLIARLWARTSATIAKMGRPKRLYKITASRTALVVIDMQEGFCSSSACIEIPASRTIVPNINSLTRACRKSGIPVYWIRLNNTSRNKTEGLWPLFQPRSPVSPDRPNPPSVFRDSKAATEIYDKLLIDKRRDTHVSKTRYSAFISGSSQLNELLKNAGRDTVVITGVGTDVCCESTARDAMMLDYRVIFVSDATATVNRVFHEVALMHIKMFFGDVVSTQELLLEI